MDNVLKNTKMRKSIDKKIETFSGNNAFRSEYEKKYPF